MAGIFIVGVIQVLCLAGMYLVQHFESRAKLIPRRTKNFRYLQDWNTITIGDWIGLSIIDVAIIPKLLFADVPVYYAMLAIVLGFFFTALVFRHFLSPTHVPDSGAPRTGVLSLSGTYHGVYFFLQLSMGFFAFILLCIGVLSTGEIYAVLVGAAIYAGSLLADWKKFLPRSET